jgi:hypothetical protein
MEKFLRSKIPVLTAAGHSFFLAVFIWFTGFKKEGIFVGLWTPTVLYLGAFVYAGRISR